MLWLIGKEGVVVLRSPLAMIVSWCVWLCRRGCRNRKARILLKIAIINIYQCIYTIFYLIHTIVNNRINPLIDNEKHHLFRYIFGLEVKVVCKLDNTGDKRTGSSRDGKLSSSPTALPEVLQLLRRPFKNELALSLKIVFPISLLMFVPRNPCRQLVPQRKSAWRYS